MDLHTQQLKNEYTFDKSHTVETLRNSLAVDFQEHVDNYVNQLKEYYSQTDFTYTIKDGTVKNWNTKEERFSDINSLDIEAIAWTCLVHCLTQKDATFTQVIGKFYKQFKHLTDRQNLESASEFIGILNKTPFINVIYPRDAEEGVLKIHSNVELGPDMKEYLNNQRFTLPSLTIPEPVTTNRGTGYKSIRGSILLGGRHHEHGLCLDHINRANAVALSLEPRVFSKAKPKFKDKVETDTEREKRLTNYTQCNAESADIYKQLLNSGNRFHLTHRYCSRGRVYAHGYHCNTQGDNFRKAVLVLADKELIQM